MNTVDRLGIQKNMNGHLGIQFGDNMLDGDDSSETLDKAISMLNQAQAKVGVWRKQARIRERSERVMAFHKAMRDLDPEDYASIDKGYITRFADGYRAATTEQGDSDGS